MACPPGPNGEVCTAEGPHGGDHEARVIPPGGNFPKKVYWYDQRPAASTLAQRKEPTTGNLVGLIHQVEGSVLEILSFDETPSVKTWRKDGSQTEMDNGERHETTKVLHAGSGEAKALMFMCRTPDVGMTDEEGVVNMERDGDHSTLGSIRRRFSALRKLGYIAWRQVDFNQKTGKVICEQRTNPGKSGGEANVNYVTEEGKLRGAYLAEYGTTHPKIDQ